MAASSSSVSLDFLQEKLKIPLLQEKRDVWSTKLSSKYVIFCEDRIVYLGSNLTEAIQRFDLSRPSLLSMVRDIDHLSELFDEHMAAMKLKKVACNPTGKEMRAVGADFIDLTKISEPIELEMCQGSDSCDSAVETPEPNTLEQGGSHASNSSEGDQS